MIVNILAYLGTIHCEPVYFAADARQLIPCLINLYTEPFADLSPLPTHPVCR